MRTTINGLVVMSVLMGSPHGIAAGELPAGQALQLSDVFEPGNLSAICSVGDLLVIGSDEGDAKHGIDNRKVQVFKLVDRDVSHVRDIRLRAPSKGEIDIEGLACDGREVYVIGSHSLAREKVESQDSRDDNVTRLQSTKVEPSRDSLYRFELAADGSPSHLVRMSLRAALASEPVLARALDVPSKENGIDIEGLAVKGGRLYVGFRGPVLRENWVPILEVSTTNEDPKVTRRFFVNLGGLGIRDMASVEDGFLIVAGPVGDGPGDFRLFLWDGKDCLPGSGSPGGVVKELGIFPKASSAKPEGLGVLQETSTAWDMLVVYDDAKVEKDARSVDATMLHVSKPN